MAHSTAPHYHTATACELHHGRRWRLQAVALATRAERFEFAIWWRKLRKLKCFGWHLLAMCTDCADCRVARRVELRASATRSFFSEQGLSQKQSVSSVSSPSRLPGNCVCVRLLKEFVRVLSLLSARMCVLALARELCEIYKLPLLGRLVRAPDSDGRAA